MKKKKIFITIVPLIVITLILILLLTPKQNSWIDEALKKEYEIYSLSCDGTTNILDKKVLKNIKKHWNSLVNNGPFLGNLNTCYKKIIIDNNNEIIDIEIIDETSIIIKTNESTDYYIYYTNASKLVKHLKQYFN